MTATRGGATRHPGADNRHDFAQPWQNLAAIRRKCGFSQGQLAHGIVGTSAMSHIEAGRLIPSERVLVQLASKLGVESELLCATWLPWRRRTLVRKLLTQTVRLENASALLDLLNREACLLTSFELSVYRAFCAVVTEDFDGASRALYEAWFSHGDGSAVENWPGTARERFAVLCLEAGVQAGICRLEQRYLAESYWKDAARQRTTL